MTGMIAEAAAACGGISVLLHLRARGHIRQLRRNLPHFAYNEVLNP